MNVFLKQGNQNTILVKPGSLATVLANDCPPFNTCMFAIYQYIEGMIGPPLIVWTGSAVANWRGEAYLDMIVMPNGQGTYGLSAQCQGGVYSAEIYFEVSVNAPDPPETMVLYKSYATPLNSSYQGKAQKATFSFSSGPEQLDLINEFFVNSYVDECANAVQSKSPTDELLMTRVYRDTSQSWVTNYVVEITATDRTGDPLPWALIIVVALALIATWLIIRPILQAVEDVLYGPGDGGAGGGVTGLVSYIPWIIGGIGLILITNLLRGTGKAK
jgi:hypothetical protein